MKILFTVFCILMGTTAVSVEAGTEPRRNPDLVPVAVDQVYTPTGFDDNDITQIILEGTFPTACYRAGEVELAISHETKSIKFTFWAYQYPGDCAPMATSFMKVVDLGILDQGTYSIHEKNHSTGEAVEWFALNVAKAHSPKRDENLYAPVKWVSLEKAEDGETLIQLRGYLTNSCMRLFEKDIQAMKTRSNLIEVLPVMTMMPGGPEACYATRYPFTRLLPVPPETESGKYLIHVRKMDGESANLIDHIQRD